MHSRQLQNSDTELLIIENVGNLVCPAGPYDLGEDIKVIIASTTEGDDKPLKYPAMFRNSSALVINKIDLLPFVNCSIDAIKNNALSINPGRKIFEVSCRTDEGIEEWCDWLENQINNEEKKTTNLKQKGAVQGVGFRPFIFRLAESLNLKGYVINSYLQALSSRLKAPKRF